MFWSKIWFFLVAVAAVFAFTIALVMPRPAQRAVANEEKRRLTVACGVVEILLEGDARNRVDLAGSFARTEKVVAELADASGAATLDDARMKKARDVGASVMDTIKGARKPDFAIMIDKKGRVVARVGVAADEYGDVVAGRPLVDDALAGYLRDDLWAQNGTMYFVSASPVIKQTEYVGAIVLGHQLTNDFAKKLLGESLLVSLGFYFGTDTVAATETIPVEQKTMQAGLALLKGPDLKSDCTNAINKPLPISARNDGYTALLARLPGEAGARGGYYSVFVKKPAEIGFGATLGVVTQEDLAFSNFPWIPVVAGFLLILAAGIALMLFESDRPLRRLAADTVRLAKGETERLAEDAHPGKFGSIARSVNIHIDKLGREAKTAKKDLDQLLGPAPEGSLGTIDLLATALPSVRPGGPAPASSPPPSEFRFGDSGPQQARPVTARPATPPPIARQNPSGAQPVARPPATPPFGITPAPSSLSPMSALGAPPPVLPPEEKRPQISFRPATQPGVPAPSAPVAPVSAGASISAPLTLDDDILGGEASPPAAAAGAGPAYFRQVYDQFVSVKKSCGESTTGLTYEKFSEKLIKNRDDLMAKTQCREVRFTVYVKDGKAALKATPVKDE